MVLARGTTKEVKGDMWVRQRWLGADGGGGEVGKYKAAAGGGG
jgi:hypothetical protein